jgi:hypothetical protein
MSFTKREILEKPAPKHCNTYAIYASFARDLGKPHETT